MTQDALKELLAKLSPAKRKLLALELAGVDGVKASSGPEPLAIVGVSCRFPGGANDPEAYWQLLREAREAICEVPSARWDLDKYYDADPDVPGKMYVRESGFLKDVDLAEFDAQFFGIAPPEAASLDPQQRLLLEVSWEALERAGQAPSELVGSRTGVFVGVSTNDYMMEHLKRTGAEGIDAYWFSGTGFCVAAGRISYVLGLQGPAMAVDTMCSSSLVALQLAGQHLRERRCDLALVGGVNVMVNPEFTVYCCKGRFVAADGRCKTFDVGADGYARGEGCGVLVVRRLADAIERGDKILAVVRGTAVNEDGRSSSLTAPNGLAQRAVIREALQNAGVGPEAVLYAEAHGTGTPLGDPIELQSIASVLTGVERPVPLPVGAVKTNVGHLEAGAGMAGLLKIILTLQHDELVPNLNLNETNPDIPLEELRLLLPTERRPWPRHRNKRIASISAFAFQGTNSHVVLEEPPVVAAPENPLERPLHVLALSARSQAALQGLARRYARTLRETPSLRVADVCFTANTGRTHFQHRLAVTGATTADLLQGVDAFARGAGGEGLRSSSAAAGDGKLAWCFDTLSVTPVIERSLLTTMPAIRAALASCEEHARPLLTVPSLDLTGLATDRPLRGGMDTATGAVLAFAVQYALGQAWLSLGLRPEVLLGRGIGAVVAATLAQSLSLADALAISIGVAKASAAGGPLHLPTELVRRVAPPRILLASNVSGELASGVSELGIEHWKRASEVRLAPAFAAAKRHGCTALLDVCGAAQQDTFGKGQVFLGTSDRAVEWKTIIEAVASFYAAGFDVAWKAVDAGFKRQRVVLPTYAFQRQRYWFETEQVPATPVLLTDHGPSADDMARTLDTVESMGEAEIETLLRANA
ncbi:MAG TPA: type I polyketide synthase [Myxococcota bacterium]|nr:type I polyketide synthase [Myxococcota bacterium]